MAGAEAGSGGESGYAAFVSYRRARGRRVAKWLSERLERYRPSEALLAKLPSEVGQRLTRPRRIFLDVRFERGNNDFWERHIVPALQASRTLVVLSTPDAFEPRDDGSANWVAREIDAFLDSPEHVGRILVALGPGAPEDRFPGRLSSLSERWDWADLRGYRRLYWLWPSRARRVEDAFTKLLAGVFDIPGEFAPELRGEEQRRRNALRLTAAALLVLLAGTAGVAGLMVAEARNQRANKLRAQSTVLAAEAREVLRAGNAEEAYLIAAQAVRWSSAAAFARRPASDDGDSILLLAARYMLAPRVPAGEAFSLSPNGEMALTYKREAGDGKIEAYRVVNGGATKIWRLRTGRLGGQGRGGAFVGFSPDGRLLLAQVSSAAPDEPQRDIGNLPSYPIVVDLERGRSLDLDWPFPCGVLRPVRA
jgi:hypothetical protein